MPEKISFWRILAAGILYAIVSQVINTLGAFFSMGYYLMEEYFPVWSKVMMPAAGPPPSSFYVYSICFGVLMGMLFAIVYSVIKSGVPGRTAVKKGLVYGLLVFLVAGIPLSLTMYLLIYLPAGLLWIWAVTSLIAYLVSGVITAKICK
jgi:hypothetical protein